LRQSQVRLEELDRLASAVLNCWVLSTHAHKSNHIRSKCQMSLDFCFCMSLCFCHGR
jgi:hypothetical protein